MGIFSSLFGKPVDKVGSDVRQNTDLVDAHMKESHDQISEIGDFTFEYLYTSSEPITRSGDYGSVIYIRVQSPVHENVSSLPIDFKELQDSIDIHQLQNSVLPRHLSKEKTRWMYFNMGKIFRVT